jgi:periplasmic protein CpxP/Spy
MKNFAVKAAVPALLTLAVFATSAWAQDAASGTAAAPAAAPAASAPSAPAAAPAAGGKKHGDEVEAQIKSLHDQIKITPAQEQQWDAFAQVMRDNAAKTRDAYKERGSKFSSMNADDSMKSYAALAQMHADNMQKLSTAFSTLYASLSDEQKADADAAFRYEHRKHHHHGGGTKPAPAAAPAAAPSAN